MCNFLIMFSICFFRTSCLSIAPLLVQPCMYFSHIFSLRHVQDTTNDITHLPKTQFFLSVSPNTLTSASLPNFYFFAIDSSFPHTSSVSHVYIKSALFTLSIQEPPISTPSVPRRISNPPLWLPGLIRPSLHPSRFSLPITAHQNTGAGRIGSSFKEYVERFICSLTPCSPGLVQQGEPACTEQLRCAGVQRCTQALTHKTRTHTYA